jgi:hypothetical protein
MHRARNFMLTVLYIAKIAAAGGAGNMCRSGPRHSQSVRRGGFTFIELCFGLVITSLVMGAVAAFTLSVSRAWRYSDQVQAAAVHARQTTVRLGRLVQDARLIGAVEAGGLTGTPSAPAAVLIWVRDTNNDGAIQGAECAMIEHDPIGKALQVYPAGQGDAVVALPWAVFTSPAVLANFKIGRTATPITRGVENARFTTHGVGSTTQAPSLEYVLKLTSRKSSPGATDVDQMSLEYGTCSVRAPARQPS